MDRKWHRSHATQLSVNSQHHSPAPPSSWGRELHVPEGPVVVVGHSLHQVEGGSRQTADGPVPVVPHPHVQVPRVEVLKILVQRHEILKPSGENTWGDRYGWLQGLEKTTYGFSLVSWHYCWFTDEKACSVNLGDAGTRGRTLEANWCLFTWSIG